MWVNAAGRRERDKGGNVGERIAISHITMREAGGSDLTPATLSLPPGMGGGNLTTTLSLPPPTPPTCRTVSNDCAAEVASRRASSRAAICGGERW